MHQVTREKKKDAKKQNQYFESSTGHYDYSLWILANFHEDTQNTGFFRTKSAWYFLKSVFFLRSQYHWSWFGYVTASILTVRTTTQLLVWSCSLEKHDVPLLALVHNSKIGGQPYASITYNWIVINNRDKLQINLLASNPFIQQIKFRGNLKNILRFLAVDIILSLLLV